MTERIPFDLEAAKNGAAIVTREGKSAKFVGYNEDFNYPVRAVVDTDIGEEGFTVTGQYFENLEDGNDLFMAEAPKQEAASNTSGHDDKVDAHVRLPGLFDGMFIRNSNEAFRDKLIIELSLSMLPHGHTPESVMDAVDTIMKRRATVPMA